MPGIVVGIDGSAHSHRALDWAVKEAALRHTPLTVVTVYRTVVGYGGGAVDYPGDQALSGQTRKAAEEATAKTLAEAGDQRPEQVTVEAVSGIPAEELVHASKDADMIVVGSRGTGGFSRLLLGSVSSQVAHHAHCPVVVIPADERH
jgi:nucleotide-binding universal stress UspA family protein